MYPGCRKNQVALELRRNLEALEGWRMQISRVSQHFRVGTPFVGLLS